MPVIQTDKSSAASRSKIHRRKKKGQIIGMLFFLSIYLVISTGGLVLYGPFENLRSTVIGAVLTSRHPWYIEYFYSSTALAKYRPVGMDKMSEGTMKASNFSSVNDTGIEVIPIEAKKYSGSLLVIKDPKRVHVAVTKYINNVGQTVSEMVKDANAVGGINAGGFYDVKGKGTGGIPMGITVSHGRYVSGDQTVRQPLIGITQNGALVIGKYAYNEIKELGIQDAVSFGPELVKDGKPFLEETDGSWGIAPRSAIGQRSDGAILLLALSGRGNGGVGGTLLDCEKIMLDNGAQFAANLDGGYSSELYYKGDFLVPPSNPLGERYVATSFVIDGVGNGEKH
ncbi:phosphodiester glycosidase family protein [Aneurinibacillus tyrosinisolvens]|uniref:phosphodiester glycosidase family protein n=1 Tax=Aneurinibacillus tyrosinisolvens TaxID=1443435 RepID=UPI00063FCFA5|nr:phosphodiester glycosidase family protein [Aneurinibacillus tyrosinisolvens]